ncbi:MAG: hypothetical protein O9331_16235 [Acidovorax sp.]|nr:hypothetical protein [Acidovorax sp.]
MTTSTDEIATVDLERELLRVFATARAEDISSSVLSVVNRLRYAGLHLKEVKMHAKVAVATGLVFSDEENEPMNDEEEDERLQQFHHSMFYLGKHVIECVQHLHAIADTTAYALYHLVDLTQQLKSSEVYSHKLLKYPEQLGMFETPLKTLVDCERFSYLRDFNNQAKHKGLPKPRLLDSSEESEPIHRLFFGPIAQKHDVSHRQGVRYIHSNIPIVPFLEDEIKRMADVHNEFVTKLMAHVLVQPSRAVALGQSAA